MVWQYVSWAFYKRPNDTDAGVIKSFICCGNMLRGVSRQIFERRRVVKVRMQGHIACISFESPPVCAVGYTKLNFLILGAAKVYDSILPVETS